MFVFNIIVPFFNLHWDVELEAMQLDNTRYLTRINVFVIKERFGKISPTATMQALHPSLSFCHSIIPETKVGKLLS